MLKWPGSQPVFTPLLAQHRICVERKLTKPESVLKIIEINIQLPIKFLGNLSIQDDEQFRKREGNKSMVLLASWLNNGVRTKLPLSHRS